MSKNLDQIYIANPITSNSNTDLMYFMESPYTSGTDAGMTFANFASQFVRSTHGSPTWSSIGVNTTAIANHAYLVTSSIDLTLPQGSASTLGDTIYVLINNNTSPNIKPHAGDAIYITGGNGNAATTALTCNPPNGNSANGYYCTLVYTSAGTWLAEISGTTADWQLDGFPFCNAVNISPQIPTTGFSITIANGIDLLQLSPAGTLATGTIIMPSNPQNGQVIRVSTTQTITALTVSANAGQTIVLAPTTLTAGNGFAFVFNSTVWSPVYQPSSGGGSSPWVAGAGTGSAIGGDGTCTAAGNNALSYGSSGNRAIGVSSVCFGDGNSVFNNNAFCAGNGNSLGGVGAACFGQTNTVSANWSFTSGLNNINNSSFGMVMGLSNECDAGNACFLGGGHCRNNGQDYTFMWGDNIGTTNYPTGAGQFIINASGGFFIWQGNGVFALKVDSSGNVINGKGESDQSYSIQTPATGASITIGAGVRRLLLNPAGTLATLTVTMPAAPIKGQLITVSCSQIVTSLTFSANAGQSILNAPSAFTAGQKVDYCYDLATTTWLVG
jgi:hypothetical protein